MLIRIFSDIHTEISEESIKAIQPLETDQETILILAGDISSIRQNKSYIRCLTKEFFDRFRRTIYIAGNHEYYDGSIANVDDKYREYFAQFSNVSFLQQDTLDIDGVVFLGCTLWTDMNKGNPIDTWNCSKLMNDYRLIRDGNKEDPYKRRFTTERSIILHQKHLKWLKEQLAIHSNRTVVVVTHHLPSFNCIHDYYKTNSKTNAAYYSDLDYLFEENNISMYIHGHSHLANEFVINNTLIVSNPVGYPKEKTGYDPIALFEIVIKTYKQGAANE